MKNQMRNYIIFGVAAVLFMSGLLVTAVSYAGPPRDSANGHGTLIDAGERRQFSFHAQRQSNGTVKGSAVLHNPAFPGTTYGNGYQAKFDITCMKVVGNVAIFGGTVRRTNDPNLIDAAFFSVQDNGEPGSNDKISRVYFWDDDPNTTGDPQACELMGPGDLPLENIEAGNIQVKSN